LAKCKELKILECTESGIEGLVNTEGLCNESPEVGDKIEVNEVTAPVPTTDDGGVILFRGSIMTCVL
jgi:hypothetical protein